MFPQIHEKQNKVNQESKKAKERTEYRTLYATKPKTEPKAKHQNHNISITTALWGLYHASS